MSRAYIYLNQNQQAAHRLLFEEATHEGAGCRPGLRKLLLFLLEQSFIQTVQELNST